MFSPSASNGSYEVRSEAVIPPSQSRNITSPFHYSNSASPVACANNPQTQSLLQTPTQQQITREPQPLYHPYYYSAIREFHHSPNEIRSIDNYPASDERASSNAPMQNAYIPRQASFYPHSQYSTALNGETVWPRYGSFSGSSDSTSTLESESASSHADSIEVIQPPEYSTTVPEAPLRTVDSSMSHIYANQQAPSSQHYHYPPQYYHHPHWMTLAAPAFSESYSWRDSMPSFPSTVVHGSAPRQPNTDHLYLYYHDQPPSHPSSHASWGSSLQQLQQPQQQQAPFFNGYQQPRNRAVHSQLYQASPPIFSAPVIGFSSAPNRPSTAAVVDHSSGPSELQSDRTLPPPSIQNVYTASRDSNFVMSSLHDENQPSHPIDTRFGTDTSQQHTPQASLPYRNNSTLSTTAGVSTNVHPTATVAIDPTGSCMEANRVYPHSSKGGKRVETDKRVARQRNLGIDDRTLSANGSTPNGSCDNKVRRPWPSKFEDQVLSEEDLKLPAVKRRRIYINTLEQHCNQIHKVLQEHGLSSQGQPLPTWQKSKSKDTKLSIVRFQHEINMLRNRLSHLNNKQAGSGPSNAKSSDPLALSPHPHAAEGR